MHVKHITLLITLLNFFHLTYAQSDDCEIGEKMAMMDKAKSTYGIYFFALPDAYTTTYNHVLQNHGIQVKMAGDIITKIGECYNNKMESYIKDEFGQDFFDIVKLKADSIHNTGQFNRPAAFPGGEKALAAYLEDQLSIEQKDFTQLSKVHLEFIISETGSISDVRVVKAISDCGECNESAITLVQNMPKWLFRIEHGIAVKSRMNIAIPLKR